MSAEPARARWLEASAFAIPLALYLLTLAPTVTLEDSGEFIVAARTLGVLHPSGYPLWCLVAHAFTWLPLGSVAERVHLCSAVFGAASCWLLFRIALRSGGRRDAAWIAALALGVSAVLWSQSVVAEVYTLNLFFTLLAVEWTLRFEESRETRWLLALALALGLGLANHPMLVLVAPPLLLWLLAIDARKLLTPRILVAGTLLVALGLSVYAYVPLRARQEPPVNVGRATTFERTLDHVLRRAYQTEAEQKRYGGDSADLARHSLAALRDTGRALSWPLALLSAVGAAILARRRPALFWTCAAIAVLGSLGLNALLGARYNAWWAWVHRVYYLPLHAVAALCLAHACGALLARARGAGPRAWLAGALALLALVAGSAWLHLPEASRRGDHRARDFALDLLDSAPLGAGFVPLGDEILYPLLYMRFVEGVRPDVVVMREDLGWDGGSVNALMSGLPIGPALVRDNPDLATFHTVPRGLVYRFARRPHPDEWRAFEPLPGDPRDAGLESAEGDRFVDVLRRLYAAYHARLGALHLSNGRRGPARAELQRAEALNPGDAFVDVLLYRIYRDFDLRPEHRARLLRAALDDYDRLVDPAIDRYYPIERSQIEAMVDALPPAPEREPPGRPSS